MRKALYVMGILDDSDVEWIVANGTHDRLSKNAILIREGEPTQHLFILLDGELGVTAGNIDVATLFAGEIVGEISFVDARPPLATVRAKQDSQVLAVSRAALQKKLETDPPFASRFYRALATFLADRLRMTTSRLGYGQASQDTDSSEEIDLDMMENMSMAAIRFDRLLKRLLGASPRMN
jgi:CRP/FNR family transcriptional regulator, cyclic AMP receptor protein